jgi:SAM-dependent methyltransferase
MIIFQPDRYFLKEQIKKHSAKISGMMLDAGSGRYGRYDGVLKFERRISLSNDPAGEPDLIANLSKIPLADNSIDSILCTQVLGDVYEPLIVLAELHRVLKPGGYLLLSESLLGELHDEPNDFWRFTSHSLKYLLTKTGFEIEIIEQRGGFFSARAQLNIRYLVSRFNLYRRWWSFFLRPLIRFYSQVMIILDQLDKSDINRRYALGFLVIAKKPEISNI